jgi:hypothetical protein
MALQDGIVSVLDYGASPSKTKEENKQALQNAISAVAGAGRGVIEVPPNVEYGYIRRNISTHPDFTGIEADIVVVDYSDGDSYDASGGKDGMQARYFYNTANETGGRTDGNGQWVRGKWAPYLFISNDGNNETNNRRATLFFANDGAASWGIGQGVNTAGENAPVGASADELSHFKITAFGIQGVSQETMLAINKVNGFWGFGGMQNPDVEYHFKTKRDTNGRFKFEAHQGNVYQELATPTKSRKIVVQESTGDFNVTNVAGTSNVFQLTDEGNANFKSGVSGGVCSSSNRPTNVKQGTMIYDTSQGCPIYWNGSAWKRVHDNVSV